MKKWLKLMILSLLAVCCVPGTCAQGGEKTPLVFENKKEIPLWENAADMPYYDEEAYEKNIGTITPYLTGEDGGCVIVCPGGGYGNVATKKEGIAPAEALNKQGINAFVLKYRIIPYHYEAMLSDVLRAVRFVRYYAEDFGINPDKIAVMGFSAGGHLAAMSMEHAEDQLEGKKDEIDQVSARPDFGILCYPVITMSGEYALEVCQENFFGEEKMHDETLQKAYSAELGVTEDMPPCFIWHCKPDHTVPYQNSQLFAEAMEEAGAECQLHLYESGDHGVVLAEDNEEVKSWFTDCVNWLKDGGIMEKESVKPQETQNTQKTEGQTEKKASHKDFPVAAVVVILVVIAGAAAGFFTARAKKKQS